MNELRDETDFEADLADALGTDMRCDDMLAQEVYGALCNREWKHTDGTTYSCSWRYAGGLVAEIRNTGDECYLDFYCNGGEGRCTAQVADALSARGWSSEDL